jgi:hypothetical protein
MSFYNKNQDMLVYCYNIVNKSVYDFSTGIWNCTDSVVILFVVLFDDLIVVETQKPNVFFLLKKIQDPVSMNFFFKVNNMKYWHPHLPFGQHISVSTLVVFEI